jgi:hypothetical protein
MKRRWFPLSSFQPVVTQSGGGIEWWFPRPVYLEAEGFMVWLKTSIFTIIAPGAIIALIP